MVETISRKGGDGGILDFRLHTKRGKALVLISLLSSFTLIHRRGRINRALLSLDLTTQEGGTFPLRHCIATHEQRLYITNHGLCDCWIWARHREWSKNWR